LGHCEDERKANDGKDVHDVGLLEGIVTIYNMRILLFCLSVDVGSLDINIIP
jgi:hypothetical protein